MPRVDTFNELPGKLTLHVYVDHLPPHFHVRSPNSNGKIEIETLQIIRGEISDKDYLEALTWAGQPGNRQKLEDAWRDLNERD